MSDQRTANNVLTVALRTNHGPSGSCTCSFQSKSCMGKKNARNFHTTCNYAGNDQQGSVDRAQELSSAVFNRSLEHPESLLMVLALPKALLTSICSFSCNFCASVSSWEEESLKEAIAFAMASSSFEWASSHLLPLFLFLPDSEEKPGVEEKITEQFSLPFF